MRSRIGGILKFSDNTSCYYDSVIVQWDSAEYERTHRGWKVIRYRHAPEWFRDQDQAYIRAGQLVVEARLEIIPDTV